MSVVTDCVTVPSVAVTFMPPTGPFGEPTVPTIEATPALTVRSTPLELFPAARSTNVVEAP